MPHRKKARRSFYKTLERHRHDLVSGVFISTILFLLMFFWAYLLSWSTLVQKERWRLIPVSEAAGTKNIYWHILSTGQSLSLGVNSSPVLSTTQPYNNLMFYKGADQTTAPLMVGGNLRDSDSSVSPAPGSTGRPLYNWAVAFDEPVL